MNLKFKNPSISRLIFSLLGICYVWSLPLLADLGFAQSGSTSISQFIANPPATGAMAAISFIPLTLMWEYQDYILNSNGYLNIERIWIGTLTSFQIFYGLFLTCTDGVVPDWLHTSTVILFGLSFICHSMIIVWYIESSVISKIVLGIGMISFVGLTCAPGMWFWVLECVGFSSMLIFTPLEWTLLNKSSDMYSLF